MLDINADNRCGSVPIFEHTIQVLPLTNDVGSNVSYTCDLGHIFNDGTEVNTLVCNYNKTWEGTVPTCTGLS